MAEDADEVQSQELDRIATEKTRKLALLLDHYGIDRSASDAAGRLFWALLEDHVPGFRVERPRHKPTTWTMSRQADLIASVEELKLEGASDIDAVRTLIRTGRFTGEEESLRRQLNDFRKADSALGALHKVLLNENDPSRELWSSFRKMFGTEPDGD